MTLALLLSLLKRAAPYLIVLGVFCGWSYGAYHYGTSHQAATDKVAFEDYVNRRDASDAAAQTAADAIKKAQEETWSNKIHDADVQHQKEMTDAQAAYDHDVAALRSGALRVRPAASCPAAGKPGVPAPAAGPGVGDGSQASGLSDANAQFLLRLGQRADDVVRQLAECQAVVAADRATVGQE